MAFSFTSKMSFRDLLIIYLERCLPHLILEISSPAGLKCVPAPEDQNQSIARHQVFAKLDGMLMSELIETLDSVMLEQG